MGRGSQGLLLLLLLTFTAALQGAPQLNPLSVGWTPPGERWLSWETEHFRIHALQRHQHWVAHLASEAELAHREMAPQFLWHPRDKTELVLSDDHDLANGWASVYPFAQARLYLSPPDRFDTLEAYDDWLRLLLRHEYTHVLHFDQGEGAPLWLRKLFGRMPLLFPHQFQPLWLSEGLAMAQETDHRHGAGRGQSALMAGRMRAELLGDGSVSLGRVSGLNRDWPGDQPYLYGVFFIEFLEERLGPGAVQAWLRAYRGRLVPYGMNPSARQAFGRDYPALWREYQQWLYRRFPPRMDAESPGRAITASGLFDAPPVAHGEGVWRIAQDGHGPAWLRRYTASGSEALTRVDHPGPFDVDAHGTVVMAAMRLRRDNRLVSDLYRWQRDEGWTRLTRHGRYRQARWLPDGGLLARRLVDGISELHRLDRDGQLREVLWRGEPGEVLGPLALPPDGNTAIAPFKRPRQGGWQLAAFDLAARRWTLLSDNADIQGQPSFSADGTGLLFSADYDGHFDLYRLELASGEVTRLHRSASGAFTPVETLDGAIWYQRYHSGGHDLYRLESPLDEPAPLPSPASAPTPMPEPVTLSPGQPYSPWSTLRPHWWLPVFGASEESWQLGLQSGGQDALGRHSYQLVAAGDQLSGAFLGTLLYQYDNRYQLQAQRQLAFYDGSVGRVRAEDSLTLSRLNLLGMLDDQASLSLGLFHERDHDLWRAAGLPAWVDVRRTLLGLSWHFDNRASYWHSISPASGGSLRLIAETHDAFGDDYAGHVVQLDGWHYRHLGRSHVLATRLAGVEAGEEAALFRLGGEQPIGAIYGRNRYPLRGYRDGDLYGRRLGLASAEWRFPLARPQHNWGVYPLGIRDVHGQLFIDHGHIWHGPHPATSGRSFTGVGAQLTSELVLGYRALVPLELGAARGLDEELGGRRYWLRLGLAW